MLFFLLKKSLFSLKRHRKLCIFVSNLPNFELQLFDKENSSPNLTESAQLFVKKSYLTEDTLKVQPILLPDCPILATEDDFEEIKAFDEMEHPKFEPTVQPNYPKKHYTLFVDLVLKEKQIAFYDRRRFCSNCLESPENCHGFSCDVCFKVFKHQVSLERHLRVHVEGENRVCQVCGEFFLNIQEKRNHIFFQVTL